MQAFHTLTASVVPLDRSNIDTDAIIPKQFLKSIRRSGFGPHLFDEWRYLDHGEPGMDCSTRPINPDFILNQAIYKDAKILLTRENFGCGSSREHAPWALEDFGIRVLIGPSFADIFYNNCFKNGLLPIVLNSMIMDQLFDQSEPGYELTIDLDAQTVMTPDGKEFCFEIDGSRKCRLLNGLDDIDLSLQNAEEIRNYELLRQKQAPWLFNEL